MRSSENYGYSLEKAMQYRKSRTSERKIVLERIILLVFQYNSAGLKYLVGIYNN